MEGGEVVFGFSLCASVADDLGRVNCDFCSTLWPANPRNSIVRQPLLANPQVDGNDDSSTRSTERRQNRTMSHTLHCAQGHEWTPSVDAASAASRASLPGLRCSRRDAYAAGCQG